MTSALIAIASVIGGSAAGLGVTAGLGDYVLRHSPPHEVESIKQLLRSVGAGSIADQY